MPRAKEVVHHPDMPRPYGAYSNAVRAGGFLFLSGLAGIVPETGQKAEGGVEAEMMQAFENLKAVLACSGATLGDVVRVTAYLADSEARPVLNRLFERYFPTDPPARSTPIVALPMGLALSLEATALSRA